MYVNKLAYKLAMYFTWKYVFENQIIPSKIDRLKYSEKTTKKRCLINMINQDFSTVIRHDKKGQGFNTVKRRFYHGQIKGFSSVYFATKKQ